MTLRGTDRPLAEGYDGTLLDLDGTVHRTGTVLPGVVDALRSSRRTHGLVHVYVTNNASRTPRELVADLAAMGVETDETHVFTSAQAAARLAVAQVGVGAEVLVVGGSGVREAVAVGRAPTGRGREAGRTSSSRAGSPIWAGGSSRRARSPCSTGAFWVATNLDLTLPTSRGVAPGNGSFVHALSLASGRKPDLVAGKPEPEILIEAAAAADLSHPLVVGDRLDTDIEGANAAGLDSLLVLSGVTDAYALLAADVAQRPTYVSAGLDALLAPMPVTLVDDEGNASCGTARVGRDASGLLDLLADGEPIDVLRAACAAAWQTPGAAGLTGRSGGVDRGASNGGSVGDRRYDGRSLAVLLLPQGELMVTNALRAYLQLATGLTEVTKQKATDAAKQLSAQLGVQGDEAIATAGAVASIASQQIQTLTDDLLAAAKSNRKLLSDLVQFEVDRGATAARQARPAAARGAARCRTPPRGRDRQPDGRRTRPRPPHRPPRRPPTGPRPPTPARSPPRRRRRRPPKKAAAKTTAAKATSAERKKATAKKAPAKKTAAKKAARRRQPRRLPARDRARSRS